jgi:hypothetical protein
LEFTTVATNLWTPSVAFTIDLNFMFSNIKKMFFCDSTHTHIQITMATDSAEMAKQTEKWLMGNVPKHKRNPDKFTMHVRSDGMVIFVFAPYETKNTLYKYPNKM